MIWFFLYQFGITPYNPLLSFFFALEVILILILIRKKKLLIKILVLLLIQTAYFKLIPLLYLEKEVTIRNIKTELLVFIIYNLYLLLNQTNILNVYKQLFDDLEHKDYKHTFFAKYFVKFYDTYL
jgi:hypothetical protein